MMAMNDTALSDYVTFTTAEQIFGLPIECVQDVFKPSRITRVPLAGPEIAGVLNLRGRIVTAIELRSRLGLGARDEGQVPMAIGIESRGESSAFWSTPSAKCSSWPTTSASRTRSISTVISDASPRACTGSTGTSWSFSTSTGCLISALKPRWRKGDDDDECVCDGNKFKAGAPAKRGVRTL